MHLGLCHWACTSVSPHAREPACDGVRLRLCVLANRRKGVPPGLCLSRWLGVLTLRAVAAGSPGPACALCVDPVRVPQEMALVEIEVMNQLNHRNLIQLYDALETPREIILFMEL